MWNDECGRYSKQNQCYFRYTAWLKRPNFWVYVSPGSAETLARGGGITNHHLIAYLLSNTSANNYQNRLMCVQVIVCYISVVFLRHSVRSLRCIARASASYPRRYQSSSRWITSSETGWGLCWGTIACMDSADLAKTIECITSDFCR